MNAFYLLGIISTFQHVINIFKLLGDFTFCFRSVYFTTPPLRPGTIQKFGSYFKLPHWIARVYTALQTRPAEVSVGRVLARRGGASQGALGGAELLRARLGPRRLP